MFDRVAAVMMLSTTAVQRSLAIGFVSRTFERRVKIWVMFAAPGVLRLLVNVCKLPLCFHFTLQNFHSASILSI